MAVTERDVIEALRGVVDPEVHKDLVALNQVKNVRVVEENVAVEISTPSSLKERIRHDIETAIKHLPGVDMVLVNFVGQAPARPAGASGGGHGAGHAPHGEPPRKPLAGVKHIIAVGAGKGGVGKSTIAVNLAIGLARQGKNVGLLDGDIYGPSIPTLTGLGPRSPEVIGDRIQPFTVKSTDGKTAIKVMSIGFMVDREKALIWRGPMAHGAIKQFLEQVDWSAGEELDYLIVDLPPGTGDVALTLAQTVPLTGAVIVATPQEVALADARRAVRMFQQLSVEILGVVENMSYFVCEHGTAYDIFGRGGAQAMAQEMGLPYLGDVPIDMRLRIHSDAGTPFDNFAAACASSNALTQLADMLEKQVAVRLASRPEAKPLNLQIS